MRFIVFFDEVSVDEIFIGVFIGIKNYFGVVVW